MVGQQLHENRITVRMCGNWILFRVLLPISIYFVSVYGLAVLRYLNVNTVGEKMEKGAEICILVTLDKKMPANL